jgi:hypothetical protein
MAAESKTTLDHIHLLGTDCELYAEQRRDGIVFTMGTKQEGGASFEVVMPVSEAWRLAKWLHATTRPSIRQRVVSALKFGK